MVTITEKQFEGMLEKLDVVRARCDNGSIAYKMSGQSRYTVDAWVSGGDYFCAIKNIDYCGGVDVTNAEYVFKAMENKYRKSEEEKENERVNKAKNWLKQFGE